MWPIYPDKVGTAVVLAGGHRIGFIGPARLQEVPQKIQIRIFCHPGQEHKDRFDSDINMKRYIVIFPPHSGRE